MKKILLIEDNLQILENTSEILTLSGYNVITAKNGKEGIEAAGMENPDLIICDIMMPVLDGYHVLHILSKNPKTAHIPLIFLTAKAERSDFRKGMEMGADDYLVKPFDDMELINAVEVRLRKNEMLNKDFTRNLDGLNSFMNEAKGHDELKKLSENKDVRTLAKKELVYKENQTPRGIYFIQKGKVKTYKTHSLGKELITGLYKEGDFFGYLPLMENQSYADNAEALEPCELCFIPREEFFALLYNNAGVSRKFIQMLSNSLAEKEEQLVNLAYNSVRKRVADALITICNTFKKPDQEQVTMTIAREDLANLAGTATETTIRTLSDFREENLIAIKGSSITILNLQKLITIKN